MLAAIENNPDDSLVVFSLLTSLINHSDVVKISFFAQLVNVIAPIATRPGGEALTRSIYWPIYYVYKYCRGTALKVDGVIPVYSCGKKSGIEILSCSALLSQSGSKFR